MLVQVGIRDVLDGPCAPHFHSTQKIALETNPHPHPHPTTVTLNGKDPDNLLLQKRCQQHFGLALVAHSSPVSDEVNTSISATHACRHVVTSS